MTLYSYLAIDTQGKRIKGMQDAASPIDLELQLKHSGLDLIRAKPSTSADSSLKIRRSDLITFFFNLDQLIRAGVPLMESLSDIHDSMDEPKFRKIIADLKSSIESGKHLSQAMAQHPHVFDKITVSLIRAGEESGRLPDIFTHITESLKWQDEIVTQTKSMMLYPALVASITLAVILFLMVYLVPQLAVFIQNMGQEIPFQTRALIIASTVVTHYWPIILAVPIVLLGAYKAALAFDPALKYHVDNLKLHIWLTGPLLHKTILARFSHTFALMYGAGISVLDCIAHSRDITGNLVIARHLHEVMQSIESGNSLTQSFQHVGIFPPLVLRMIKVGETTGRLDQALLNVSYFYNRDVKETVKRVQVLIEPATTVFLGVLLGWVMLAALSPIYDIIGKTTM